MGRRASETAREDFLNYQHRSTAKKKAGNRQSVEGARDTRRVSLYNPGMRYLVLWFIKDYCPKGTIIRTRGLYAKIYNQFPKECQQMGFTNSYPIEPKWKNDIRLGLLDARVQGLIKHIGPPRSRSGEWQRL